ncbi:fumarylacetoacetate hydrolase family protein [Ottowia sp. VDI28]|uniref:fumarylacetoacetate hydrolase family protein n=1 Tax=Ottowia sp. VDI28 TaxID=3133968 RepID=UPI003C2D7EA8
MKLGTVKAGGNERTACLTEAAAGVLLPVALGDLVSIIEQGEAGLQAVRTAVQAPHAERFELSEVQVLAPIRRFRRDVLCTGWNYWDHFYESEGKREGQDVPKPVAPTFFTKAPGAIIGPYDDVAYDPQISAKWDYEAEIVLIIGKTGRSIPRERALEHVFGYCLANDMSQRDLQRRHGAQWFKGKSIDTGTPLGPWIVTRDEIDLPAVQLELDLNGQRMQQATASQMAFPIDELISELSFGMTLHAGDVLLTGTPSGIGNARTPPVYLADGDEMIVRGSGLGELRNRMRKTPLSAYEA